MAHHHIDLNGVQTAEDVPTDFDLLQEAEMLERKITQLRNGNAMLRAEVDLLRGSRR